MGLDLLALRSLVQGVRVYEKGMDVALWGLAPERSPNGYTDVSYSATAFLRGTYDRSAIE